MPGWVGMFWFHGLVGHHTLAYNACLGPEEHFGQRSSIACYSAVERYPVAGCSEPPGCRAC